MIAGERARLTAELAYYAQHKYKWLKLQSGKYVVLKGDAVLGFYPNFELAYRAGATEYGINTDFLVKQILEHDPVYFVF
jgi:hypothetical protein